MTENKLAHSTRIEEAEESEGSDLEPFSHSSESFIPSNTELDSDDEQVSEEPDKKKRKKKADKSSWKRAIVKKKDLVE